MKQENYRLISLAQAGDKKALEELTIQNRGLIWSIARRFSSRGAESEDLFQIGAIGLIKAIKKFDTSFDVEFSTYAVPVIMGEIKRFLRDDGIIKVSRKLKETANAARCAAEKISLEKGRDASLFEIAEMINETPAQTAMALEAVQSPESIYKKVNDGDKNSLLLIDKIGNCENNEDGILTKVALRCAIKNLPEKERQILMLRYFKEKTQSEVAKIMGVSQVQISRTEKKLLCGLRKDIG